MRKRVTPVKTSCCFHSLSLNSSNETVLLMLRGQAACASREASSLHSLLRLFRGVQAAWGGRGNATEQLMSDNDTSRAMGSAFLRIFYLPKAPENILNY